MILEEKSFTINLIRIEGFQLQKLFIHIMCNFKFVFSNKVLGYCSLLVSGIVFVLNSE
jgi:hypothetical protein